MSATVYYHLIPRNASILKNATSSVLAALETQFGKMPITLNESQVQQLEAMASVYDAEHGSETNPYLELSEYIKQHGSIRVWAEH